MDQAEGGGGEAIGDVREGEPPQGVEGVAAGEQGRGAEEAEAGGDGGQSVEGRRRKAGGQVARREHESGEHTGDGGADGVDGEKLAGAWQAALRQPGRFRGDGGGRLCARRAASSRRRF